MQKGKIYKAVAIIAFALIFISAVAVGNFELFRAITDGDFNFYVFFYIIISGLLSCIPIFALGEVLIRLEKGERKPLQEAVKKEETTSAKPDGWICKKCSTKNESISTFCKNCGEYK